MMKLVLLELALTFCLMGSASAQSVFSQWGNVGTANTMAIDAINQARYSSSPSAGGVTFASAQRYVAPGGVTIPVNVLGELPGVNVAAAIGRFAVKVSGPLMVGVALYDLAKELGFNARVGSDGKPVFQKETIGESCASGCFEYLMTNGSGYANLPWEKSKSGACASGAAWWASAHSNVGASGVLAGSQCQIQNWPLDHPTWVTMDYYEGIASRSIPPYSSVSVTFATAQDLADAVAAKSGWPSTSALAKTMDAAIKAGESVTVAPTSITGPASSPAVKQVVNDPVANTTSTSTTTNNYTYEGAKVTTTTVTSVSIVNNTTGAVTTGPTTTTTPIASPEPVPDPCQVNPDTLGCAKFGVAPDADPLVKKTTVVSITAVAFASSSACPSPLQFSVIGRSYGLSYQPMCDRLAMLKYLFLAMAGFVAAWMLASLFKV